MAELQADFELLPRETLEAEMSLEPREEIEATFELNVNTEGRDAKINGVNTLTLTATDGIELTQVEDVATLSAPGLKQDIANEKTARENADAALDGRIDIVAGNLAQEVLDRQSADSTLLDNIDAEVTARENADDTLQDNIDAEETARKDADEDLQDAIDTKQPIINDLDTIRSNAQAGKQASDTIATYGDIVTHDVDEFATAAQGELADTALQSGDNVSELVNDSGYLTGITSLMVTTALGYTPYNATNPNNYQTGTQVSNAVGVETTNRENADIALQQQIDAITASSDVKDIVGTHAELEDYDTSTLGNNDIIKVLQDETQNGATTYYRWNSTTQTFSLIGQEGPYYTKSEADTEFVPQTRTVNGKALSADITLSPSDIGAQPSGSYVTTNTDQDITSTKTFKGQQKIQYGGGDGCLIVGADVSDTTLTANTRKLGRMAFPTYEGTVNCAFLSLDSQLITSTPTNYLEFGGRPADRSCTSPDEIRFTIANTHNTLEDNKKKVVLDIDKSMANFTVEPRYNNAPLVTTNTAQSITAQKTFESSTWNGGIKAKRTSSSGSFIVFENSGGVLGGIGMDGDSKPLCANSTASSIATLVRSGTNSNPATGSATQPVYVDSDGKAVAITDMATTDTAQTISATKTYTARQDFSSNISDKIYLKHGQMDITTTPSAKRSNTINFRDKNAVTMGYVTQQQDTDGSSKIRLVASTYETGTTNFNVAAFEVKAYKDGTLESYIDTPPVNSNDNNIANTEWVNSQGFIKGIDSSMVTTALGYTPYDATNPNGYISGVTSSMVTTALGYTPQPAGNYVTTDTAQDITETKTFKAQQKIQSGNTAGCLLIGGDVNATTLTNGTRKIGRVNLPPKNTADPNVAVLFADNYTAAAVTVLPTGYSSDNSNSVAFGGIVGDTTGTSPDVLAFTVAKEHNATAVDKKVIALEISKEQAKFNVQPNYNGNNLAVDNEVVHLAGSETITGAKTFKESVTIQNGAGTGALTFGADVNANTVTNNTRKLGRINSPSYASGSKPTATLLGWDTQGDTGQDGMHTANKATDVVSFGGMKKITTNTSPMNIVFCVTKTRGSSAAADKIYPLEMDANEARFNVQPNYNGTNLATVNDIPTTAAEVNALPDTTKYAADLSYSSSTLQLLDQDGNTIGNSVTITNSLSGLTDVTLSTPTSGQALLYDGSKWVNGSAGVSATYDAVNERITFA